MKFLKLAITTLLLLPAMAFAATKVTFVGDVNYKPYVYMDYGVPTGKYVDIVEKAFALMPDYELEWKLMKWEDALMEVKNGDAFAIVPPYYRPEERPYIHPYSDPAVLEEKVVLFCNKDSAKDSMEYPKDFAGLTFTNDSKSASPGTELLKMVESGSITMYETPASKVNFESVVDGQSNCYVNNSLMIEALLNETGQVESNFYTRVLTTEKGYVGFAKNAAKFPYKDDFVKKFNKALKTVVEGK